MAVAADVVLRAVPHQPVVASVASSSASSSVAAHIPRDQLTDGLCFIHLRHGKNAFNCACPDTCKMKHILKKRTQRSGNAPAGGQ